MNNVNSQPEPYSVSVWGGLSPAGLHWLRYAQQHPNLQVARVFAEVDHACSLGEALSDAHSDAAGLSAASLAPLAQLRLEPFDHYQPDRTRATETTEVTETTEAKALLLACAAPPSLRTTLPASVRLLDIYSAFAGADYAPIAGSQPARPSLPIVAHSAPLHCPNYLATSISLMLAPLLQHAVPARGDIIVEAKVPQRLAQGLEPHCSGYSMLQSLHPLQQQQLADLLPGWFRVHLNVCALPASCGMQALLLSAHFFLPDGYAEGDIWHAYRTCYADAPAIRLVHPRRNTQHQPQPAHVQATNHLQLSFVMEPTSGHVMVTAALDAYGRASVGAMLQCLNQQMGWDDDAGLLAPRAS